MFVDPPASFDYLDGRPDRSSYQLVWGGRETLTAEELVRLKASITGVRPEDVQLFAIYVAT